MEESCTRLLFLLLLTVLCECNVIIEGTPYRGSIQPYETQMIQFDSEGGLKRVFYFQCTGSADLSILDSAAKEIQTFKDFVSKETGCENEESYACFADPCSVYDCATYPAAQCTSNYCDGCIAEFRVDNEMVDCSAPGTETDMIFAKGAPPHMAVLDLAQSLYSFNLLGKRSNIDNVNTFQLYVFDNSDSRDKHIMLDAEAEVQVDVDNTSVSLRWTEPPYNDVVQIKEYCIYYLEEELNVKLDGGWLACGHEIKDTAHPVKCVNSTYTTFADMARNKSHYVWVVAISAEDIPTAYPFVRIDLELPTNSRTFIISYSILLMIIAVLFLQ